MQSVVADFESIMNMAFTSGLRTIPMGCDPDTLGADPELSRRFYSACHRGFDKAQTKIVELMGCLRDGPQQTTEDALHGELILRKIADSIAFNLLFMKLHYLRRLCLVDKPGFTEMSVIRDAHDAARALNQKSRMTFALVADITTFLSVADLLQLDLRGGHAGLSLIELKSGAINRLLLHQLENYTPSADSLSRLEENCRIEATHKNQARRIIRQKIRGAQLEQLLTADVGIDPKSNKPMRLTPGEIEDDGYDEFLDHLCSSAVSDGCARGRVEDCVYLGVGFGADSSQAIEIARMCVFAEYLESFRSAPHALREVREELDSLIGRDECYLAADSFQSNLYACPNRPFPSWGIAKDHILKLVAGHLRIAALVDVAGIVYLGRKLGYDVRMSSKTAAGRLRQQVGASSLRTWGGRVPEIVGSNGASTFVGGGVAQRCITDLSLPMLHLRHLATSFDGRCGLSN